MEDIVKTLFGGLAPSLERTVIEHELVMLWANVWLLGQICQVSNQIPGRLNRAQAWDVVRNALQQKIRGNITVANALQEAVSQALQKDPPTEAVAKFAKRYDWAVREYKSVNGHAVCCFA